MGSYAFNWLTALALLLGFALLGLFLTHLRTKRTWQRALDVSRQQVTHYQQQVAEVQQQYQDSREENKQLGISLASQAAEIRAREQKLTTLQQQLLTIQQRLDQALTEQARVPVLQQELAGITTQLKTVTEREAQQQEKYKALHQKHGLLQRQLLDKENAVATLQTEVGAYAQAKQKLETQLAEVEKALAQQVASLAQVRQNHQTEVALRLDVTQRVEQLYLHLRAAAQDPGANNPVGPPSDEEPPEDPPTVTQPGDPSSPEAPPGELGKIELFLQKKNIQVKHTPVEDTSDPILNSLALQLGDDYEVLKPLYQRIKRNMQKGDSFVLHLQDEPAETINKIAQFCKHLHAIAFLEQRRYLRAPNYLLKVKTTTLPKAQSFFSGLWLERYIMQKIQQIITTVSQELQCEPAFAYLRNPRIVLPAGINSELDLIFHVNDAFYWIEAKTSDYQQHISKYSKISRVMGLDDKHAIIILPDIQSAYSEKLTSLFHMSVYSLSDFELNLSNTIKGDLLASSLRKEDASNPG